jgi:hypothetical protein
MEKLDQILNSYVAAGSAKPGQNELLGAAFVVVDKNGELTDLDMP